MRSPQVRELISQRCNEAVNSKKNSYQYIGRCVPYGYKLDKKSGQLIIDQKVSNIVYTIFDLYDKGYGFTTIADYLNERGIVPSSLYKSTGEYIGSYNSKPPVKWEKSAIRKIILNKVYSGSYQYTNEKTHPAIIDEFLWSSIQVKYKNKIVNSAHDFYDKNGNEFCGKVFCALCGKPFTIETSKCKEGIVKYLRCSCYDKRGGQKCICENKLAIRYDELRDIVSFFLEQNVLENANLKCMQDEFYKIIKSDRIDIHRKYLKQEKKELTALIKKYSEIISNNKNDDLYDKLLREDSINKIKSFRNRLEEVENLLKEKYALGRTKLVSNKDLHIDKFLIDKFVNKIEIGVLQNSERKIQIILN